MVIFNSYVCLPDGTCPIREAHHDVAGGIFVDWQLHPGMVQQLLAAHQSSRQEGFWYLGCIGMEPAKESS